MLVCGLAKFWHTLACLLQHWAAGHAGIGKPPELSVPPTALRRAGSRVRPETQPLAGRSPGPAWAASRPPLCGLLIAFLLGSPAPCSQMQEVLSPEEVYLPNGMAWDEAKGVVYFADSGTETIVQYQADDKVGGA